MTDEHNSIVSQPPTHGQHIIEIYVMVKNNFSPCALSISIEVDEDRFTTTQ